MYTLARCLHKAATKSLQTCVEESSDFVCRRICFQFSPRADSARRFPKHGQWWGLPGTAGQRGAARSEGAESPALRKSRTCCRTNTKEPLRVPRWAEETAYRRTRRRFPATWINSDTGSTNRSQENPVDSKNDKVEFIKSRFMWKCRDMNLIQIASCPLRTEDRFRFQGHITSHLDIYIYRGIKKIKFLVCAHTVKLEKF